MKLKASLFSLIGTFLTIIAPTISLAQGLSCGPDSLSMFSVQPKVFIGYMFPNRPTTLSIDTSGSVFQIHSLEQSFNVQGLWTELVVPIRCPSPLGFAMGLGYLFPANYRSRETYITGEGVAKRTWSTSTQMVNFQVAATYRFSTSVTGILGFRYDSFMTNYLEPENLLQNPLIFNGDQRADLTISGDIPFAGAMVERTFWNGANLKAGAIGLPTLPGQIEYREAVITSVPSTGLGAILSREFRSGYFLEGFAELSIPISRWGQMGAFAKYNGVYGRATKANVSRGGSDTTTIEANVTFDRSSWMFGGTISAGF